MEVFVCHDCDNIYLSKEDFTSHSLGCVVIKTTLKQSTSAPPVGKVLGGFEKGTVSNTVIKTTAIVSQTEINPPPDNVRHCPFCSVYVVDVTTGDLLRARLEKHVRKRHPEKCGTAIPWESGPYRDKCEFCLLEFSTHSALKLHIKRKHDTTIKKISCEVCGKLYHPSHMHSHMTRIHGERNIECKICHKISSGLYNLKRHVKYTHENIRNKQCQDCGKRFINNPTLRKHIMVVHQKLKPFKCDCCDFLCGTINNLNHHRKMIHAATDTLTLKNFNNLSLKEIQEKFTQSDEL